MRASFACAIIATASIVTSGAALAQSASPKATCANPNALGVARTVEIDTTGGPGFGFEHFSSTTSCATTKWC